MSRRILLADDSVTIQKVIELTFMDDDYEVRAVGNGDEALAMLSALDIDFVIADIHMPGANGYEVCRQSKQRHPDVPVLLLVGTFEPFDEAQAKASGADSYLKKPFDSQELLQRVHELLADKTAAGTPQAQAPSEPSHEAQAAQQAEQPPVPPDLLVATSSAPLQAPPPQAGFYAAPTPGADAMEPSWEGFELEAEPEPHFAELPDLPEPAPSDQTAAPPPPERRFAFGDHQPFTLPEEGLFGRDQPPASGPQGAVVARADRQEVEQGGQPYSFDEPLDENVFELEPAEVPATAAAAASPGSAQASGPAAPPPTLEERAGAPAGQAPFSASLAETEAKIEEHQAPPPAEANGGGRLSDEEVERIARRVVELIGDRVVRDIAWEVIPDLAEVVIKDRLRELESQVE